MKAPTWLVNTIKAVLTSSLVLICIAVVGLVVVAKSQPKYVDPNVTLVKYMTNDLIHRTAVCNHMIDTMSPLNQVTPTFQCIMMASGMEHLDKFMQMKHLANKPAVKALIKADQTFYKFREYLDAIQQVSGHSSNVPTVPPNPNGLQS